MEHRKKRGQISVEYIAIVGFVLIILSGTMVFFQGYVMSSKEHITKTKVDIIANTIIDNAREIYYLGEGSKKVITVEMPEGIQNMSVVNETGGNESYFLLFDIYATKDNTRMFFESEVPIISDVDFSACTPNIDHAKCSKLSEFFYSPGKKQIKLEAKMLSGYTIIQIGMQPE